MENPEEILHSLEEFSKMKPKDIPRELEEYLCFVAKTGDPVYQWSSIKSLFREKLINVVQEFYESCPVMEIPPCPNVEMFNYDLMKNFILEKLETFTAAPFTLQRICELLTTPRKEYNRIDKFMRALEKNILVVSTTEPGGRRSAENGEGIMNGIESEHVPEPGNEINIEEMDESPSWSETIPTNHVSFESRMEEQTIDLQNTNNSDAFDQLKASTESITSSQENVISCSVEEDQYVSIEAVTEEIHTHSTDSKTETDISVTITAVNVKPNVLENTESEQISERKDENDRVPVEKEEMNECELKEVPDKEVPKEIPSASEPEVTAQQIGQEEVRMPSETAGIENISPETSASSPETLKDSISIAESKPEEPDVTKLSETDGEEKSEEISANPPSEDVQSLQEAGDSGIGEKDTAPPSEGAEIEEKTQEQTEELPKNQIDIEPQKTEEETKETLMEVEVVEAAPISEDKEEERVNPEPLV